MRILTIGGFYGTGKTTLILKLSKIFSQIYNKKVAIIVNDLGKIGIDDKVVKEAGLSVRELFGGCICCELSSTLAETLQNLKDRFNPDIVILEPSGMARPAQILADVQYLKGEIIEKSSMVILVDPVMFNMLSDMPIVQDQLRAAKILAINKIDLVDKSVVGMVEEKLKIFNPQAEIMHISALEGIKVDELANKLIS
ncbi:Zinc-binding GTPase YeiR [archaeon HR06]|nr:Zinc-binding GTPase YeiR [archaeon HR06]